jgi:hypothetical protein
MKDRKAMVGYGQTLKGAGTRWLKLWAWTTMQREDAKFITDSTSKAGTLHGLYSYAKSRELS